MKKILFLLPYPLHKAPSQRLKFEQYYPYFEKDGFEITTSSFINEEFWEFVYQKKNIIKKIKYTISAYLKRYYVLFTLHKYDVVYVHLWITPFGMPIAEKLGAFFAKKLIYDIDDLIFIGHSSEANVFLQYFKGKAKPLYLIKKAKHVITCTPYLDDFVKKINPNTSDISSTINTDTYVVANNYKNNKLITLGWSGSHSTSKYLYLLSNILLELQKTHLFKLLVIGDINFKIPGLANIEAVPWNENTEVAELQKIDIGLYPLPYEEWVLGKSGLKALQYMALGIPTVATAIGANYRIIKQNESGFLVNTPSEWLNALKKLIENEQLRQEIGTNARKTVVDCYSLQANKSTYLKILNN